MAKKQFFLVCISLLTVVASILLVGNNYANRQSEGMLAEIIGKTKAIKLRPSGSADCLRMTLYPDSADDESLFDGYYRVEPVGSDYLIVTKKYTYDTGVKWERQVIRVDRIVTITRQSDKKRDSFTE